MNNSSAHPQTPVKPQEVPGKENTPNAPEAKIDFLFILFLQHSV